MTNFNMIFAIVNALSLSANGNKESNEGNDGSCGISGNAKPLHCDEPYPEKSNHSSKNDLVLHLFS